MAAAARAAGRQYNQQQAQLPRVQRKTRVLSFTLPQESHDQPPAEVSPSSHLPGRHIRQNSWVEPSLIRLDSDGPLAAIDPPLSPNDALRRQKGAPPTHRLPDLGTKSTQAHRKGASPPAGGQGCPPVADNGVSAGAEVWEGNDEPSSGDGLRRPPPKKQSSLAMAQEWTEKFKCKVTERMPA